jgi:neutral ceramidase
VRRLALPLLLVPVLLCVGAGPGSATAAAAPGRCPAGAAFLAGAAKADITPRVWPVAEAAYSIGRLGRSAAHPFYARAIALRSCSNGQTVVITSIDSQGYFAAYKQDPLGGEGYGADGIRAAASRVTGVPASHLVISATHTHNSPDSVGVWGGGSQPNNGAPYLSVVKAGAVHAIRAAVAALRPATLLVGTADISSLQSTVSQVASDPGDYPVDSQLRVLQAVGLSDCAPISTLVDASVHATVAGEIKDRAGHDVIDPDWPGRVATDLEHLLPGEVPVVVPGAVGRTQPRFPKGQQPASKDPLVAIAAYGDILTRRVGTALSAATAVPAGPVLAERAFLREEIEDPALVALFYDQNGVPGPSGSPELGGLMRSVLPPYTAGDVVRAEAQLLRVGDVALATTPGEAYPQNATELRARISDRATFLIGTANDQVGYSPPAYEYPFVALADGGDEGVFTINPHLGSDLVNSHLASARAAGFRTSGTEPYLGTGAVLPPDQLTPTDPPAKAEPVERPLHLACSRAKPDAGTTPAPSRGAIPRGGRLPTTGGGTALALAGLLVLCAAAGLTGVSGSRAPGRLQRPQVRRGPGAAGPP